MDEDSRRSRDEEQEGAVVQAEKPSKTPARNNNRRETGTVAR
jgi:hypothetical protein